jgi:hypothetical protein
MTKMKRQLREHLFSIMVLIACISAASGAFAIDSAASNGSAETRTRPWHVGHGPGSDPRILWVAVRSGYCYGDPKPQIDHIKVIESAATGGRYGRAILTVFEHYPAPSQAAGLCQDVGLTLKKPVRLGRPVERLALYDGSFNPPRLIADRGVVR